MYRHRKSKNKPHPPSYISEAGYRSKQKMRAIINNTHPKRGPKARRIERRRRAARSAGRVMAPAIRIPL